MKPERAVSATPLSTACQRVPDAAPGLASQPTLSRLENLAGRRALARMGLRYG